MKRQNNEKEEKDGGKGDGKRIQDGKLRSEETRKHEQRRSYEKCKENV